MKYSILAAAAAAMAVASLAHGAEPAASGFALGPIQKVEIATNRAFIVNGRPFFPLMAWLQDAENFPALRACGMNATAGYHSKSSGTEHVGQYLDLVEKAGLYGVMPFDERLRGRPGLLAYIHGDEPDLSHEESDAKVEPGPGLALNSKTPLWRMIDGVTHSWSVLDPLDKASVTIRLKEPVTVTALAVYLTVSPGLDVAKEIRFEGDGKEVLTAALKSEKGQQKFPLASPATFRELRLTVTQTYPGKNGWGSIGEIEGLGAAGKNVLASPPRQVVRAEPADVLRQYQAIKAADPSRPVFMTLTGNFHPQFKKWPDAQREAMYPEYVKAADVVGYDIYPIYGWNKPEWIHLVQEATDRLVKMAAPRPVYAWIETSKGGQWTGALESQKDVTPAHIRAEVWMSITRGATAIGYFTHIWKPAYKQFGVPEENRKALREVNDQITRLSGAILSPDGPPRPVTIDGGGVKLDALARSEGGRLYVFAVNYDERAKEARATVRMEGLPAGRKVEVIDEGRTLSTDAGGFADTFAPLAVHIYRLDLK